MARCRTFGTHAWRCTLAAWACASAWWARPDEASEHFEKRVRPVLVERCYSCHSAGASKLKGGLRVDSRDALLRGGDTGPAIVPGEPGRSRLIEAIEYANTDFQMPPKGKLPENEIAAVTEWVRAGAPWPAGAAAEAAPATQEAFDLAARRASHWSWRPVRAPAVPRVNDSAWVRQPTDAFLLAALDAAGLKPAPAAARRSLIRRLAFDLTGLPPSPDEVERFVNDPSSDAWAALVDRLLASPRFGERWARHWLDLVRYAETLGHEFDYPTPNAWRYRDYVIRAFNADVPYDRFAAEHVAGDLLDPPRRHPTEGFNESIIGTSFYWLGQRTHSPVDVRQHQAEVLDDQIDVLSKTFLGLTVACARCHDHKFDAISTRDYYALYGILSSSRYAQRQIAAPAGMGEIRTRLSTLRGDLVSALPPSTAPAPPPPDSPATPAPGGRVFADFARDSLEGWFRDGEAFAAAPLPAGSLAVLSSNRVARLRQPAVHSAHDARRFQGLLASPTFVISNRFLHVLAAGRGSRLNVRVDNFTMIRDPIYGSLRRLLDHDDCRWITIDVATWRGRRAYLEFNDLAAPDLAADGPPTDAALDGYIAVAVVVFSDEPQPPAAPRPAEVIEFVDLAPASPAAALARSFRETEAGLPDPARVPAMMEGTGWDEVVFVRGNHRNPGDRVPRRFLEAFSNGPPAPFHSGSGRLELMRALRAPENPFFARVIVNRVWLHLFGRGLVPTPDDFGVLGQPPSHPELLDWLAHWFQTEGGWSVKRLVRLLVTSHAYQMSSRPEDPRAEELDPTNRLWHRMPIRRLEGEVIRDSILATSGRLDLTMYGPPVPVHLTEFMDGRGRPAASGPLDGAGRRSIYLEVRRNFLSPMLRAFDTPVPFTTVGRRTVSNVPAQSLMLMNDPFVHGEADRWAERLLASSPGSTEARLNALYRTALGRPPTPLELTESQSFLLEQSRHQGEAAPAAEDPRAWANLCHVLLNVKEFIYLD